MGKVIFSRSFTVFGKAFGFEIEIGWALLFGLVWSNPDYVVVIGCFAFVLNRKSWQDTKNSCIVPARTFDDL